MYKRIISLAPSATEILFSLGLSDLIVAVTRFCDYPDSAKFKDKVGGWLDVDYSKLMAFKPDLVVTSSFCQDKVVAKLKEYGVKVLHSDPKTLDEVYLSIMEISRVVGVEEKGVELVSEIKDKFNNLIISNRKKHLIENNFKSNEINVNNNSNKNDIKTKLKINNLPIINENNSFNNKNKLKNGGNISKNNQKNNLMTDNYYLKTKIPRIYVEEWGKPPTVSGNWVPKIIEMAGCLSMIDEGVISREISLEKLKTFDPDFMIVSWCGFGDKVDLDLVVNRPGWKDLRVVKNRKIFVFNDSLLNRPGPRLCEGLVKVLEIINNN